MKSINITYAGRTVALPDLREYAKFYRKLAAGSWEPRTFEVLARNLDHATVYIDIGSWIGVIPFWASQTAKSVFAVEPDPKCCEILQALAPGCGNVTVLPCALSVDKVATIHAVGEFGSSETSMLDIGDGLSATATGLAMEDIMRQAGSSPVFVKIDIEGYEYLAGSEIAKLSQYRLKGVQIAVHPQLFERSLPGNFMAHRLLTVWRTWELSRTLGGFSPPTIAKYGGIFNYLVFGILLRKSPKGADFLFERRLPESSYGAQ
jgi:FkbM family methyltransferase